MFAYSYPSLQHVLCREKGLQVSQSLRQEDLGEVRLPLALAVSEPLLRQLSQGQASGFCSPCIGPEQRTVAFSEPTVTQG